MPLSAKGVLCSFSGAESKIGRLIDERALSPEDAAAEVYSFLSRAVARMLAEAVRQTGAKRALLAGGVASSALLRRLLPARLKRLKCDACISWAAPEYSGDNACGVALIGEELYREAH